MMYLTEQSLGVLVLGLTEWLSLRISFTLGDSDNSARKVSQTRHRGTGRRSHYNFRFPLRGMTSRRSRGGILTDQLTIGQATTGDRGQRIHESLSIVPFASIEAEGLLI